MFFKPIKVVFQVLLLLTDPDIWLPVLHIDQHLLASYQIQVLLTGHWGHRHFKPILPDDLPHGIIDGDAIPQSLGVEFLEHLGFFRVPKASLGRSGRMQLFRR